MRTPMVVHAAQSHDIVNNTMGFPAEGSHRTGGGGVTHYQQYCQIHDDIAGSAHRAVCTPHSNGFLMYVGDMGTLYYQVNHFSLEKYRTAATSESPGGRVRPEMAFPFKKIKWLPINAASLAPLLTCCSFIVCIVKCNHVLSPIYHCDTYNQSIQIVITPANSRLIH